MTHMPYIKPVIAICYLAFLTLLFYWGYKRDEKDEQALLKGDLSSKSRSWTYLISLSVIFILFSLLTLTFSVTTFTVLIIFTGICQFLIAAMLEPFVGLSLTEKKEKITHLSLLVTLQDNFNKKRSNPQTLVGLTLIVCWLLSLFVFLYLPIGERTTQIYLAWLCFLAPIILGAIYSMYEYFPLMTSTYVDDDLRNYYLIRSLPSAITTSIWLFYPMWLLNQPATPDNSMTSWVLVLIPIATFFLLNIIPYFIGVHNFKHHSINLLNSRFETLNKLYTLSALPDGQICQTLITNEKQALKLEIQDLNHRNVSRHMKDRLDHTSSTTSKLTNDIIKYLTANLEKMSKWDIRLVHLIKLEEIGRIIEAEDLPRLKDYLNMELQNIQRDIQKANNRKGLFFGVTIGIFSGVASLLIKWSQPFFEHAFMLFNSIFY
jgi:hypothetical protein